MLDLPRVFRSKANSIPFIEAKFFKWIKESLLIAWKSSFLYIHVAKFAD